MVAGDLGAGFGGDDEPATPLVDRVDIAVPPTRLRQPGPPVGGADVVATLLNTVRAEGVPVAADVAALAQALGAPGDGPAEATRPPEAGRARRRRGAPLAVRLPRGLSTDLGLAMHLPAEELPAGTLVNEVDGTLFAPVAGAMYSVGGGLTPEGGRTLTVEMPAFYVAIHPVTNEQFLRFLDEVDWPPRSDPGRACLRLSVQRAAILTPDHPVVGVNLTDGRAYGEWSGTQLPLEFEAEIAAAGPQRSQFPWGERWDSTRCRWLGNRGTDTTCGIFDYPAGRSPFGLYGASGNVAELVLNAWEPTYDRYAVGDTGLRAAVDRCVLRGGSWRHYQPAAFTTRFRTFAYTFVRCPWIGFRLVHTTD